MNRPFFGVWIGFRAGLAQALTLFVEKVCLTFSYFKFEIKGYIPHLTGIIHHSSLIAIDTGPSIPDNRHLGASHPRLERYYP